MDYRGWGKLMRMKIGYCCGFGFSLISRRERKVRLYDFFISSYWMPCHASSLVL